MEDVQYPSSKEHSQLLKNKFSEQISAMLLCCGLLKFPRTLC